MHGHVFLIMKNVLVFWRVHVYFLKPVYAGPTLYYGKLFRKSVKCILYIVYIMNKLTDAKLRNSVNSGTKFDTRKCAANNLNKIAKRI